MEAETPKVILRVVITKTEWWNQSLENADCRLVRKVWYVYGIVPINDWESKIGTKSRTSNSLPLWSQRSPRVTDFAISLSSYRRKKHLYEEKGHRPFRCVLSTLSNHDFIQTKVDLGALINSAKHALLKLPTFADTEITARQFIEAINQGWFSEDLYSITH